MLWVAGERDGRALDRMAAEGVRFGDFYMAAPLCSPSRGAMMTGCYPRRIGFGSFDNGAGVLFPGMSTGLSTDEVTLAKLLKGRGYATRIVGKWHCGDQREHLPTRHGFDGYFGIPYSNDMGRQANTKQDYPPLPLMLDEEPIQQQPDQAALTERYVDDCVRFMRANRERPFFLYFAQMYVHLPIYAPQRFLGESRNGPYGAAVASIDWSVGAILAELKALGVGREHAGDLTSDNGSRGDHGGSNAPLRGAKTSTWEGGQRVPCIMRWPGRITPGQVTAEVATAMDFLPTFAGVAGASLPDKKIDARTFCRWRRARRRARMRCSITIGAMTWRRYGAAGGSCTWRSGTEPVLEALRSAGGYRRDTQPGGRPAGDCGRSAAACGGGAGGSG